jgi:hypothetical protein
MRIGTAVPQGVPVDLDRATAERLHALSGIEGESDLALVVLDLARSAQAAVPSFLALRVTIHGAEQPITVATRESFAGRVDVRSSLRLEIAIAGEVGHHHSVVYLAEQPDAFIDFRKASDWISSTAEILFQDQIERLVVDGDVPSDGMTGFAAEGRRLCGAGEGQSSVEQAVGALMSCGFTAEAARMELDVRARSSRRSAVEEALALLRSLRGTVPAIRDPGPVPQ